LGKALDSILAQSFRDFEIVVVNDCGQGVEQIITPRGAQAPITYIRHGNNRERSATRNSGIKAAQGKYIAYLDDDDLFYPDHLETLVNYLQSTQSQVAYTDANRAWQIQKGGEYITAKRDLPYSYDFDYDSILVTNFIPILCIMHEKACLDKVGLFDEGLATHEDWELWIRMSRAFSFNHIRKATCEFSWRDDGSSTTSSRRSDFARTVKLIYDRYRAEAEAKPNVMAGRNKVTAAWGAELGNDSTTSSAIKEDAAMIQATTSTPTSPRAEEFKRLGTEAKKARNHEEALRCFSQAREAGDFSAISDMGDCLARLGKTDEALALYDEAIRENPGDPRPLLGKGVIKIIKGDGKEAALLFSSVLKQNETVVKALSGMGMTRQLEGKTAEAMTCFKLALEADPEEPAALGELVRCSYELNCPGDAEPYLVKYLMYHPTDPDMIFTLAGNFFHQGKFTEAKDHLERLLILNPEYQDGAVLLAKTQECLSNGSNNQRTNLSVAR
jgi:tetratricopeptide (TPR) repeat protein